MKKSKIGLYVVCYSITWLICYSMVLVMVRNTVFGPILFSLPIIAWFLYTKEKEREDV